MAEADRQIILFMADHAEQYGVRLMLESCGYRLVNRNTLVSGLQYLMAQQVDLVLIDCALDGNRGLELCRTVCSDATYKGVPTVMIGRDDKQAANCLQAFSYGAEDFVQAPFMPAVLQARIGRLMKKNLQGAIGASLSVQVIANELPGIMQYLESEMKTGKLNIESGENTAAIYFIEGNMVNATTPAMEGMDVVTEILCWPTSQITFIEETVGKENKKFESQITGVIMNCAVEVDEYHEMRSELPQTNAIFVAGKPLPQDAPEPMRQIYHAALHGYAVEDLVRGIYPSERKATLWLTQLIKDEHLAVGEPPFQDYEKKCTKFYRSSYLANKLSGLRQILASIEFPIKPGAHAQLASCDWLSPIPRLIVTGDNAEHVQLFVNSLGELYKAAAQKIAPQRRKGRKVAVTRMEFGGKASIEVMTLAQVADPEFAVGLNDYLQDSFAILHIASAQDRETNRNVQRVERLLRQSFTGAHYHMVPRVFTDDGKCLFKINCEHCGFKLAVDMAEAGFSGECPVCGRNISIPDSMDSLSHALALPEEVPVVRIEPANPLHCRDLMLLLLDAVLHYCAEPQHTTEVEPTHEPSAVQESPKVRRTQIAVAETQAFRIEGDLISPPNGTDESGNPLPQAPQYEPVDPSAFAPLPQTDDTTDGPKVDEILELLSNEKPQDDGVNLDALLQDNEEDLDDFINSVSGPE